MELTTIAIGLIMFALGSRLVAGFHDKGRVERYFRDMGCEVIGMTWQMFGPGWFGCNCRIYLIVYRARDGRWHEVHVKTAMLKGVYLTNDRMTKNCLNQSVEDLKTVLRRNLAELEES